MFGVVGLSVDGLVRWLFGCVGWVVVWLIGWLVDSGRLFFFLSLCFSCVVVFVFLPTCLLPSLSASLYLFVVLSPRLSSPPSLWVVVPLVFLSLPVFVRTSLDLSVSAGLCQSLFYFPKRLMHKG